MRLIIGIHSPNEDAKAIARLVTNSLKTDQKTYFINFKLDTAHDPLSLKELEALNTQLAKRIINIPFNRAQGVSQESYNGYAENFTKTVQKLKTQLEKNEFVELTFLGGAAKLCFEDINQGSLTIMRKVFFRRIKNAKTYLPLVWGSRYTNRLVRRKASQDKYRAKIKALRPNKKR